MPDPLVCRRCLAELVSGSRAGWVNPDGLIECPDCQASPRPAKHRPQEPFTARGRCLCQTGGVPDLGWWSRSNLVATPKGQVPAHLPTCPHSLLRATTTIPARRRGAVRVRVAA